jgi:hypothetical protein
MCTSLAARDASLYCKVHQSETCNQKGLSTLECSEADALCSVLLGFCLLFPVSRVRAQAEVRAETTVRAETAVRAETTVTAVTAETAATGERAVTSSLLIYFVRMSPVPGSHFPVPMFPQFPVPSSQFAVPSSRFLPVPSSQFPVPCSLFPVLTLPSS